MRPLLSTPTALSVLDMSCEEDALESRSFEQDTAATIPVQHQHQSPGKRLTFDLGALLHYVRLPDDRTYEFAEAIDHGDFGLQRSLSRRQSKSELRVEQMLHAYDIKARFSFYSDSVGLHQGPALQSISSDVLAATQQAGDAFWLDIGCPQESDILVLSKIFKLHPLTTEALMLPQEAREKYESFDHYRVLCTRAVTNDFSSPVHLSETTIFLLVFPSCVVSVRHVVVDHPRQMLVKLMRMCGSSAHAAVRCVPDWIVYALLDSVVDSFRPIIKAIEYDVDCIDDLVLILSVEEKGDMLRRIRCANKKMLRLLQAKGELLKTLVHRRTEYFGQDVGQYLMDTFDHVQNMQETLQMTFETLRNAHNIYLSGVSVELSQVSNDSNVIAKQIATISAVFLPMTVITGLFGMNVTVPLQKADDPEDPVWFWAILAAMAGMAVLMLAVGKRTGNL
ncbi:CorA metal ion transporter [Sorochytrium milnesiophthora]